MNTIPIHVVHAGKPQNARLKVVLSKMPLYNVDSVLNIVAAALEPFECAEFCSRCDISEAHEKKWVDDHIYECDGLSRRHRILRGLCLRLKRLIDLGRFQVWDSEMHHAQEFPWTDVTPGLRYGHFKTWSRSSFIFPDDLSIFLHVEKICVSYASYSTDSDGNITTDLSDEKKKQDTLASTTENASEESREAAVPKTPAALDHDAEISRNRSRRFDYLAVEIDELLTNDATMTPSLVWYALTTKVGVGNTCIVSVSDVGLRWKNAKGELKLASASNLAERVDRWKKRHR